jgi:5-methylcytosine-specific restriction endonuclease McrA
MSSRSSVASDAKPEGRLSNNRNTASRPELNKAQWQRIRRAVRRRDGNACRNCGASDEWAKLSVHHLVPAKVGGTDTMDNLITLCQICHPQYEKAARTLTLDTSPRKRTQRKGPHGAPFRSPDGQPWSRQWYDY